MEQNRLELQPVEKAFWFRERRRIGKISLCFSGLGCFLGMINAVWCWSNLYLPERVEGTFTNIVIFGGMIVFGLGLLLGIAGWRSWQGMVGMILAFFSPWFWIWLAVVVSGQPDFGHM